jgi:adenylate cyclase
MSEQRRLAAILVADVVGYPKLIGSDEAGVLEKPQSPRPAIGTATRYRSLRSE